MECRSCERPVLPNTRFCDDCGEALAVTLKDEETLRALCGHCGVRLQGNKKYCVTCGHPSPLTNKTKEKGIERLLMSTKVQVGLCILALVVILPIFRNADVAPPKPRPAPIKLGFGSDDVTTIRVKLPPGFPIEEKLDDLAEQIGEDRDESEDLKGPVAVTRDSGGDFVISW